MTKNDSYKELDEILYELINNFSKTHPECRLRYSGSTRLGEFYVARMEHPTGLSIKISGEQMDNLIHNDKCTINSDDIINQRNYEDWLKIVPNVEKNWL